MTGRAVQTLRNDRCKCKGIPYSKIGASIRYKVDDVVSFMEGHRIVPRRESGPQDKIVYWSRKADFVSRTLRIASSVIHIFMEFFSFIT
jgi:hypothetical protein